MAKSLKKGEIRRLPNGDIEIGVGFKPFLGVKPLTKQIVDADGAVRTMVSYDGDTWALDGRKLATRLTRSMAAKKRMAKGRNAVLAAHNAIKATIAGMSAKRANVERPRREARPLLLPVVARSVAGGRGRSNPKPRKIPKDRTRDIRPVHFHRCHGKRFVCSCDTPWKKSTCGGSAGCLHDISPWQFGKLLEAAFL